MKVVLAEKPSVARDIAKHLGAAKRGAGFLEGNGWVVTWAFGHMVELQEPEDYKPEWKAWRLSSLPIIPADFALRPRASDPDGTARAQLETIKKLFLEAEEIVCATDAGREGELIFRYIYTWSGCDALPAPKPFRRLWISSLTNEAIEKGFQNLAPGSDYDRLYQAAKCRSEADWIVGLNATRFFTVEYGRRNLLLSLGRVQTPILAMIVGRDLDVEHFKPEDFWEIHTLCRGATFKHTTGKFSVQAEAQAIVDRITGQDLVVTNVTQKNALTHPPLLYDLTGLQRDMNKRHGFTADQTLRLAQSLYESKHLTYPRTDSCYLSSDIQPTIGPLLDRLRALKPAEIGKLDTAALSFSRRIIDDKKVSDHHAIIPTNVLGGDLAGDEAKVYDAVVTRLIAAFYPPCIKAVTTVEASVETSAGPEPFRARGTVLIDPGWQALYGGDVADDDAEASGGGAKAKKAGKAASKKGPAENDSGEGDAKDADAADSAQPLPDFQAGERNPHEPSLPQFKTSAPKRFNEASLLQLMETAGKIVTDETLKEALKDKGVGTPATRAAIIEVLISRGYVERKKKNLISTDSGRALISLVQDERLKSPELTGDWEYRLKQIERGDYDPRTFMSEVEAYTREILQHRSEQTINLANLGPCPLCHAPVMRGRAAYGCSRWRDGCKFVLPGDYLGLTLTPVLAREVLIHKHTLAPQPVVINKDQPCLATLSLNKKGALTHDVVTQMDKAAAGNETLGRCPACGGDIVAGAKGYGCSNWRNGCRFVVWKTIAQKEITPDIVQKLLSDGITDTLGGFTSKAGKPFDAKLKVIAGEVKFDFGT